MKFVQIVVLAAPGIPELLPINDNVYTAMRGETLYEFRHTRNAPGTVYSVAGKDCRCPDDGIVTSRAWLALRRYRMQL